MYLSRLAESDGADCPRFEFRILTRLLCSVDPEKEEYVKIYSFIFISSSYSIYHLIVHRASSKFIRI